MASKGLIAYKARSLNDKIPVAGLNYVTYWSLMQGARTRMIWYSISFEPQDILIVEYIDMVASGEQGQVCSKLDHYKTRSEF